MFKGGLNAKGLELPAFVYEGQGPCMHPGWNVHASPPIPVRALHAHAARLYRVCLTVPSCLYVQDDMRRAFQLLDVHGTGKIDAFTLRRVTK